MSPVYETVSDSVVVNGKMMTNYELEGCASGDGLKWGTVPVHGWKDWGKPQKRSPLDSWSLDLNLWNAGKF